MIFKLEKYNIGKILKKQIGIFLGKESNLPELHDQVKSLILSKRDDTIMSVDSTVSYGTQYNSVDSLAEATLNLLTLNSLVDKANTNVAIHYVNMYKSFETLLASTLKKQKNMTIKLFQGMNNI